MPHSIGDGCLVNKRNVIGLLALIFSPMGLSLDRGVVYWAATLPQLWARVFLSHATAGTNNSLNAQKRCVNCNPLPSLSNTLENHPSLNKSQNNVCQSSVIYSSLKLFLCQLKTNLPYFNFFVNTEAVIKYLHSDRRDK